MALSCAVADVIDVQVEASKAKANLLLLSKVDANGVVARNLLLNALRQTGQLQLASLLDEDRRIKAFTGSGSLPSLADGSGSRPSLADGSGSLPSLPDDSGSLSSASLIQIVSTPRLMVDLFL